MAFFGRIFGENGDGKTTFVKLIAGMLEATNGSLEFMGLPVDQIKASSRYERMSAVFQEPAKYNTFTIAENVFSGDVTEKFDLKKIKDALDFAKFNGPDPEQLLGKDLGGTDLSGGQWQKIAIARAYYRGKDFIILDEPTSNLDPESETETFQSEEYTLFLFINSTSLGHICTLKLLKTKVICSLQTSTIDSNTCKVSPKNPVIKYFCRYNILYNYKKYNLVYHLYEKYNPHQSYE